MCSLCTLKFIRENIQDIINEIVRVESMVSKPTVIVDAAGSVIEYVVSTHDGPMSEALGGLKEGCNNLCNALIHHSSKIRCTHEQC